MYDINNYYICYGILENVNKLNNQEQLKLIIKFTK